MRYDWDTWDVKVNCCSELLVENLAKDFSMEYEDVYRLLDRKDIFNDIRSALSGLISYDEEE